MEALEYWKECISIAANDGGFELSNEQIDQLASGVLGGHENYSLAFYSPPSSDRLDQIEREWLKKYQALEQEFAQYRKGAETAIRRALPRKLYPDDQVSIGPNGDVFSHGGRTEQIL